MEQFMIQEIIIYIYIDAYKHLKIIIAKILEKWIAILLVKKEHN